MADQSGTEPEKKTSSHSAQTGNQPEEKTLSHATGPRSAKNLRGRGFTANFSSASSFAKGDWFLDTSNIPESVRAKGTIVLRQKVSLKGMMEITDPKVLKMLQGICGEGEGAKEMRKSVRAEAKRVAVGRAWGTGETRLQAYVRQEIVKAHPEAAEAPLIRWRNPDGTSTYLVKNKSAYLGRPERLSGQGGFATPGGLLALASSLLLIEYVWSGKNPAQRIDRVGEVGMQAGLWGTLSKIMGGTATSLAGLAVGLSGENPNQVERDRRAEWEAFFERMDKLREQDWRDFMDKPPAGLSPLGIPWGGNIPLDVPSLPRLDTSYNDIRESLK